MIEVEEFKGDPNDRALRLDDIYASDKESYFVQSSIAHGNDLKKPDSNKVSGTTEYFKLVETSTK